MTKPNAHCDQLYHPQAQNLPKIRYLPPCGLSSRQVSSLKLEDLEVLQIQQPYTGYVEFVCNLSEAWPNFENFDYGYDLKTLHFPPGIYYRMMQTPEERTYGPYSQIIHAIAQIINPGEHHIGIQEPIDYNPSILKYQSMMAKIDFAFLANTNAWGPVASLIGGKVSDEISIRAYPQVACQALMALAQLRMRGFTCAEKSDKYEWIYDFGLYFGDKFNPMRFMCTDLYLKTFCQGNILPPDNARMIRYQNADYVNGFIVKEYEQLFIKCIAYLYMRAFKDGFAFYFPKQ